MRVGVIGLGYWGSKVVDEYIALREQGEVDAVVACDADESRLDEIDNVDNSYTSLESALTDIDALHVATNNSSHFDIAKHALKADKDVLVEKPLTSNRKSAYDLVEISSETGRILQTGHIFRFANVIRKTQELYEQEYFGDVHDISLRWTHKHPPTTKTNVLWDLLPHPVDILNFVTGEWPEQPQSTVAAQRGQSIDVGHVTCEVDHVTASLHVSWVDHIRRRDLEIAGSARSACIECVDQTITVYEDNDVETIPVDSNNTIRGEARNFIQAAKTGQNTFNSAIIGARTVDAIEEIITQSDHE